MERAATTSRRMQGVAAMSPMLKDNSAEPRIAIIDIGSNSVRLVVYSGLSRAPGVLFNEKVMAGLGRGLSASNNLLEESICRAIEAIRRFALLAQAMAVDSLRAVATAAVREAANGSEFVARVAAETGVTVEVIPGETEARCAALGVIAGIPHADGVVGDMGGGSLELVRVAGGQAHERVSLPLGALRLDVLRKQSPRSFMRVLDQALEAVEWARKGGGKPFYAVGGSWRALAHLHMHLTNWPLPAIHHHLMRADAPQRLIRTLSHISLKSLKQVPSVSSSRAPQLMGAALLLKAVTRRLGSSEIITSAYGLREGLLYASLPKQAQKDDPLLVAAREEARRSGRFTEGDGTSVGDALLTFTDGLFPDDQPGWRRIRHAASLLADTVWRANPDRRAEEGLDVALHGNWVGVNAAERVMLGITLFVINGGKIPSRETRPLEPLVTPEAFERARLWGLALRLGQRMGGGSSDLIGRSSIYRDADFLVLSLEPAVAALYGESVRRRHRLLAQMMDLRPEFRLLEDQPAAAPASSACC